MKRMLWLLLLSLALPTAVFADSVDFTNSQGTLSGTSAGLSLSGSQLIAINGLSGLGLVTGNLGTVEFSTGALTGGSLQMGGTFAAGGSFVITGNGSNGIPSGVIFNGSFTGPVSWTLTTLANGTHNYMATGAGYEGTDEYTPLGADASAIDKDARKVTVIGPARADIRVQRWDAESREFTVQASAADQVALKLFLYRAWHVQVNGLPAATSEREGTGQMLVPVAAGMNHVEVTFVRTWDRTTGGWISLVTVLAVCVWIRTSRRRRTRRPQTLSS